MRSKIGKDLQFAIEQRRANAKKTQAEKSSKATAASGSEVAGVLCGNQDALLRNHRAIIHILRDLEAASEYVYLDDTNSESTPPGSWHILAVETLGDETMRAAPDPKRPGRGVVLFDDGRSMSVAAFRRWAIDHVATGASAAEKAEIENGYRPVGLRTYGEGYEFGQRWARSLAVTQILKLHAWLAEQDANDKPDPVAILCSIYGDKYDGENDNSPLYPFWNIDPFAWGRISRLPEQYLAGFFEAARGVAKRVAANLPSSEI